MSPLLEVDGLTMRFGGLTAIDGVSFSMQPGSIAAVIGPNGAGKTTLFNCLTGFYRPTAGRLTLTRGDKRFDLASLTGPRIARQAGVMRTFQNLRLFPRLTLLENLLVAQHGALMQAGNRSGALGFLPTPGWRRAEAESLALAHTWLAEVGLLDRADEPAGGLPYGQQRRLEIARAMCGRPALLCLDEPAAGLNPRESAELNRLLLTIRDRHATPILLIEHDMSVVMRISDHIVVLDYGRKIAEGAPAAVRADPAVIRAYLGEPEPDGVETAA